MLGAVSFELQVLWILSTIQLNEMLIVTLATIFTIQMGVLLTMKNSSSLIFFSLRLIQLKFLQWI